MYVPFEEKLISKEFVIDWRKKERSNLQGWILNCFFMMKRFWPFGFELCHLKGELLHSWKKNNAEFLYPTLRIAGKCVCWFFFTIASVVTASCRHLLSMIKSSPGSWPSPLALNHPLPSSPWNNCRRWRHFRCCQGFEVQILTREAGRVAKMQGSGGGKILVVKLSW